MDVGAPEMGLTAAALRRPRTPLVLNAGRHPA
jgi:hypothetical protein